MARGQCLYFCLFCLWYRIFILVLYATMKARTRQAKTFTLIELLIVVVIVGILASALISRLRNAQERTRDVIRKKDITTIGDALQLYHIDNQRYIASPNSSLPRDGWWHISHEPVWMWFLEPKYLSQVPRDPRNYAASTGPWGFESKTKESYWYMWYVYPANYALCTGFTSPFWVLGAINFEAIPDEPTKLRCPGRNRSPPIAYSLWFFFNGEYKIEP